MDRLLRILRTGRYLKHTQILHQVLNRIGRKMPYSRPLIRGSDITAPDSPIPYFPPAPVLCSGAGSDAFRLTFINQEYCVGWPPRWHDETAGKLWRYNLHYFEWIWALDYPHAREAAGNWIDTYAPGRARDGWEAYPASLRIMNWIGFFFGKHHTDTTADAAFREKLLHSLSAQTGWLKRHIEYHLLGNHVFENAAALTYAGSCLRGKAAKKWLRKGSALLTREMAEQILPDGMHFERSPMYHSRVLYVLLFLYGGVRGKLRERIGASIAGMLDALRRITHSDGDIALLNDSAFGIYPRPEVLFKYAGASGFDIPGVSCGVWKLADAGYYGYRGADGTYLICDAAKIGPDYIPGHAHADIFTYELSLKGQQVIVDSGVYDYEASAMRRYCRSTRAHNTLEVNGFNQSEVWGAFRVARRGRPRDVVFRETDDGFRLSGWHTGYRRISGRPLHHREFIWHDEGKLTVTDRIESGRTVLAVSRIHLHPECRIEDRGGDWAVVSFNGGKFRIAFTGEGELRTEDSFYCPEFTTKHSNLTLAYAFSAKRAEMTYVIELME